MAKLIYPKNDSLLGQGGGGGGLSFLFGKQATTRKSNAKRKELGAWL